MRNFEDRMAEINRRSGERIRKRQQQNRMVASVVPLVLCLTVGLTVIVRHNNVVPENIPTETHTIAVTEQKVGEVTLTSSNGGNVHTYTDPDTVQRALQILSIITTQESEQIRDGIAPHKSGGVPYAADSGQVYRIVISDGDGNTIRYRISGSELMNETDGAVYTVSQKQIDDLFKVLNFEQ